MKKILKFLKETRFPNKTKLKAGYNALSIKEAGIAFLATAIALVCVVLILGRLNSTFSNEIPISGGKITEGIIGMPTLVNPVLAVSEADKDITALVYSGLMRRMPDGSFIPDLAESYEISTDGTRYTFKIKENVKFHDNIPLTAEDVIFTINKIQDPILKSPKKVQWEGVTVESSSENEITFILKKPYASFMDNTTLGILPMHLWKNVNTAEFSSSNLNVKAIGTGPFMIKSVSRNSESIPEKFVLKRNKKFTLQKPFIEELTVKSYNNEKELVQALRSGKIDQAGGISPENAKVLESKSKDIETMVLPRMFGLFFNSANNKVLADKSIRKAIDEMIDKEKLINDVLLGYGVPIDSPVPSSILNQSSLSPSEKDFSAKKDQAIETLEKAGWKKGESGLLEKTSSKTTTSTVKGKKVTTTTKGDTSNLSFSITTGDAPELVASVTEIKRQLEEFGINVDLRIYETGQLNQIIRAREYEVLFFGQIVNHGSDLFAFWHSSQKNDPGLNIALFGNDKADLLLNIAETILSDEDRSTKYIQFENIWKEDVGAVFIYSPEYVYIMNKSINIPKNYHLTNPQGRFDNVYSWYTNTDKVWKIFSN